ncbi:helix-turn-helix domain-containing protein [Catenulispora subtropica]|uniref:Helix-turn-helix domain-containing protein n=2 Tax=Catenulispora subtropica TaxID=450798 RepID=A0ABN2R1H9_9ACTN
MVVWDTTFSHGGSEHGVGGPMITLSTDGLPFDERFGWYRELVNHSYAPSRLTCDEPDRFRMSATQVAVADVEVNAVALTPVRSGRTAALIRRSDPECLVIATVLGGTFGIARAGGAEALARRGDIVVYDTSRPYAAATTGDAEMIVTMVPRASIRLNGLDRLLGRRLPANDAAAAVLRSYLQGLVDHAAGWQPADGPRLAGAVQDLTSVFLARSLGTERQLPSESRTQALIGRIYRYVEHHIADPWLGPRRIAAAHHISVRYLHRIFESQGITVHAYVRERRLELSCRDLLDPGLPVAAIAARHGFASASSFTRVFRTAYGMTPSEYRDRRPRHSLTSG